MLIPIYFFLTLLALLIATYTDLRERIVPNRLTYALGGIGIALKALESFLASNPEPLIMSVAGGFVAFAAAYALWKLGVWAGGDVKLVSAIAILNPVNYSVLGQALFLNQWPFTPSSPLPLFAISLIIYSVLVFLPMGVMMTFSALLKHPQILHETALEIRKATGRTIATALLVSAAAVIGEFAATQAGLGYHFTGAAGFTIAIAAFLAIFLLKKKMKRLFVAGLSIAALFLSPVPFALGSAGAFVSVTAGYALIRLFFESKKHAFKQTVLSKNLEEGMIPDTHMVEVKGKIELLQAPSMRTVIKQLIDNKLEKALETAGIKGRVVARPQDAGGLTKEAAALLREKAVKGLMPREITVRKTMAFVPAILLSYLALQLTGDVLWNIILTP